MRWWSQLPAGSVSGTYPDKRFLAERLSILVTADVPDELTLRPSADLTYYQRAVAAYREIDQAHPAHRHQAQIEAQSDLDEARSAGLLYEIVIDGRWRGYVAAERGHKLGLIGFSVAELVLDSSVRGRGLGCYLTTLLARALLEVGQPDDVLVGTIHQENVGALRGARRAGRQDIGGWITYPLAELDDPTIEP